MYDDISFGTVPVITAAAASNITSSAIQWNWLVDNADGYYVWDAATAEARRRVRRRTILSRVLPPIRDIRAGCRHTRRSMPGMSARPFGPRFAPAYTLAKDPTYAASGDVTIQCDKGTTSGSLAAGSNVTFTFNNAFGDGVANVGQFGYLWDSNPGDPSSWSGEAFWTSGATLVEALGASGSRYLHIRSYNNDNPRSSAAAF